jgi:putative FmdB family regulatory protein
MPTYEYKCTECAERFEIEQSIHEDTLTVLAGDDHEHQLKKLFSPVGISFKGGGFYRNDARGPSSKSSSESTTDDAPTKISKSDTPSTTDTSSTTKKAATKKAATSTSSD